MKEGEVYKKKEVHGKKGGKTQVPRYKEETRRTLRENRVNSNISYVNVASSGPIWIEKVVHPFDKICLFFLIFLIGQSLPLVVYFPLL